MTQTQMKWEKFVDAYMANGFNRTQAAIEAGYGPDKDDAYSMARYLLSKPEIQRSIRRKQNVLAQKYEITQDWMIEQYEDAYIIAKEARDVQGMVAATTAIAKLAGLVVEQTKNENKNTNESMVTVKHPEIEDRIKRLRGELDAFLQ